MRAERAILDLFSGIGGFSLGLGWAGFHPGAFCEADAACRDILARHWPGLPIYPDIRTLDAATLERDRVRPGLVCGGFPCQDVSQAGLRAGLDGPRSGPWSHMLRIVGATRPDWVVVENVPGLRSCGADRVASELEALGYAVWPLVVGAVHAGAPHRRRRVFLLGRAAATDAARPRLEMGQPRATRAGPRLPAERPGRWPAPPRVRRVDDGLPGRVDRIRALGNAVVPQVAAMIGRAILAADEAVMASRTDAPLDTAP